MKRVKKFRVKHGKLKEREARMGYLFVSPWIIGALIFIIYPLCQSFNFALSKVKMTPKSRQVTFIGIENFTNILQQDVDFPGALASYFINTILSVPVIVVFALIIAILLNGKIKCKGLFRLIFFLPVIVVSGPVMGQLADQGAATIPSMNTTLILNLLDSFLPAMLAESITNLFSNMIMILWYSGVQILIFLSAIQKIDTTLYEAAKMDGASVWESFWKITLPTIKPMILLNAIYTIIFMSNNEQNEIITLISDAMFASDRGYGYASAMAWAYSVVVTVIVAVVALLFVTKKDVYAKKVKKIKREAKKQRRMQKRAARRGKKHEKQIDAAKKAAGI